MYEKPMLFMVMVLGFNNIVSSDSDCWINLVTFMPLKLIGSIGGIRFPVKNYCGKLSLIVATTAATIHAVEAVGHRRIGSYTLDALDCSALSLTTGFLLGSAIASFGQQHDRQMIGAATATLAAEYAYRKFMPEKNKEM